MYCFYAALQRSRGSFCVFRHCSENCFMSNFSSHSVTKHSFGIFWSRLSVSAWCIFGLHVRAFSTFFLTKFVKNWLWLSQRLFKINKAKSINFPLRLSSRIGRTRQKRAGSTISQLFTDMFILPVPLMSQTFTLDPDLFLPAMTFKNQLKFSSNPLRMANLLNIYYIIYLTSFFGASCTCKSAFSHLLLPKNSMFVIRCCTAFPCI